MKNPKPGGMRWIAAAVFLGIVGSAASWQEKMKGLDQTLQNLLLDLSSDARFNDPKNFSRIEGNAASLAKLTHDLTKKGAPAPPDGDPTLRIIAGRLAEEADHAVLALREGNREYARDVLRSTMNYCITCHTRSGDTKFKFGSGLVPDTIHGLEKANYFAATRQFDLALKEYEKIIRTRGAPNQQPFDWERSIRSGLAIAVRVKKDPDRALEITERVLATPKAPFFMREQAKAWKESILAWKKEPMMTAATEEGYYALAIRLVAEARERQKYPADRSADIVYLRASAAVHDLLSIAPKGKRATEGLYLAGLCYEVLEDLNLWDLHEFYYLACILKSPHSDQARRCFKHYEQSVYLGYSGSLGEDLPEEIQEKLQRLDKFSKPLQEAPKEKP